MAAGSLVEILMISFWLMCVMLEGFIPINLTDNIAFLFQDVDIGDAYNEFIDVFLSFKT